MVGALWYHMVTTFMVPYGVRTFLTVIVGLRCRVFLIFTRVGDFGVFLIFTRVGDFGLLGIVFLVCTLVRD